MALAVMVPDQVPLKDNSSDGDVGESPPHPVARRMTTSQRADQCLIGVSPSSSALGKQFTVMLRSVAHPDRLSNLPPRRSQVQRPLPSRRQTTSGPSNKCFLTHPPTVENGGVKLDHRAAV